MQMRQPQLHAAWTFHLDLQYHLPSTTNNCISNLSSKISVKVIDFTEWRCCFSTSLPGLKLWIMCGRPSVGRWKSGEDMLKEHCSLLPDSNCSSTQERAEVPAQSRWLNMHSEQVCERECVYALVCVCVVWVYELTDEYLENWPMNT